MDESQTTPDSGSGQEDAPARLRPRGKHRLPPRRVMQAEPIQPIAEGSDKSPQPTEPVDARELSAQEPAQEPQAAAQADDATADAASAETEATPAPPASPARSWRWFKRRRPKGPVAAAGDAAAENAPEPPTDPPEAAEPAADAPTTDAAEAPDAPEPAAEAPEDLPQAERKPVTKWVVIAVAAAAAIFVGAGAFAGAMLQPYLADRALVDTKLDIARTAANAITTLWTYTPQNMDKLPQRSAMYLAGDFADTYRKYVDGIAAANKQAQVSNSTQVMGAAVETLDGPNATAVVYTNTTYTSPVTKNVPSLQYFSYRLTMERKDSRWLITHMTTITSVDLTPKFG